MAGKPVSMSRIKQVLQLSENGFSNRQIAKYLAIVLQYIQVFILASKIKNSFLKLHYSLFIVLLLFQYSASGSAAIKRSTSPS
jgi:hypothetical protein